MKRLTMIIAIAVAANFAAFGIQPASALDAHHPGQTTNGKKAKPLALKGKAKSTKSSQMQMMNCPMMRSGKMMQGAMVRGGKMMKGDKMKCPMMGASKMQRMGMMQNMDPSGMHAMHHGEAMMGRPDPCWVATDRERGFGYRGACNR